MSDKVLAVAISAMILLVMVAWVPLLDAVCPPCARFVRARRRSLTGSEGSEVEGSVPAA